MRNTLILIYIRPSSIPVVLWSCDVEVYMAVIQTANL
jgi:hypothetical protein